MTNSKELIETLPNRTRKLREEITKAIVGQGRVVDDVLLGLSCGEHVLLTGVPGLAKTLLIRSLAETLDLGFQRIQFTPELQNMQEREVTAGRETNGVSQNSPLFGIVSG